MDPAELVRLIDILNPENRAGRITIITRMGPENMRVKLPHLIRAVRGAGQIVTWVTDPMHGNTMKAPCGLKTRSFDRILVLLFACNKLLFACNPISISGLQFYLLE
jgi:3-deoxy-7-phosphoheptulonate synthase